MNLNNVKPKVGSWIVNEVYCNKTNTEYVLNVLHKNVYNINSDTYIFVHTYNAII